MKKKNTLVLFLRHIFLHNWGFKLTALLLALSLWAGLVTQDATLTREKTFTNVTASLVGADMLKRNGLIVTSSTDDQLTGFTFKTNTPQGIYNDVTASNFNLRVDLSRISQPGTQQVRLIGTSTSSYGTVLEISPESIEVEVEEYITRYRIPVSLITSGNPPEGFYASAPTIEPNTISVSGPASLINSIVRAEATLDQSILPARAGSIRSSIGFHLIDSDGNYVESKLIEITNNSVLLDSLITEQTLYPKREINLNSLGLVTGSPAYGYEIKSVIITPEIITGAAPSEDVLDTISMLYADSTVDVTNLSESINAQIRVRKPSELVYLSPDRVTVAVEIEPVLVTRSFDNIKINLVGLDSNQTASYQIKNASVTITGRQLWIEKLKSNAITLSLDASELDTGTHVLPIQVAIADSEDEDFSVTAGPAAVEVAIAEK